jgi:hypothetical protein
MSEHGSKLDRETGEAKQTEPAAHDRWIAPFFEESGLWPVLIAAVGSAAAFGAALIVMALHDRNLFAMAGVALLAGLTIFAIDERRRRGAPLLDRVAQLLAAIWLFSLLGGLAAMHWLSP